MTEFLVDGVAAPRAVRVPLLAAGVDAVTYDQAIELIAALEQRRSAGVVCAANVHMMMEACDHSDFADILKRAELVTPDGMPLRWALGLLGMPLPDRVYGPTLALRVCAWAARSGIPVGLYGGTTDSLLAIREHLGRTYPALSIAYAWAPPFRPLAEAERAQAVQEILTSGARILLVGLGCPKQERWMDAQRSSLPLVMLGVGAFFDFQGGRVRQAPRWMQDCGLEWLFRLAMEPRRLWWRYLWGNPRFILRFAWQYFRTLAERRRLRGGRRNSHGGEG